MRVLVTGGSGFIGSHVVDKLRERDVTVRVFDMTFRAFRDASTYIMERVGWEKANIGTV